MLGPAGNPRAGNLFEIVRVLQRREGVRFEIKAARIASRRSLQAQRARA